MKFNVEGKAFQQQLQAVSKVISSKNTIKILDNFLLCLEGDRISITGSDSENVLTAFVPVMDVEGEGAIAVPAKRLLEITKEIDNQPLQFYINDDTRRSIFVSSTDISTSWVWMPTTIPCVASFQKTACLYSCRRVWCSRESRIHGSLSARRHRAPS